MSEEAERSRRTVDRLMDAEAEGWNEDERPGANERLQVALVDARGILEGGA